MTGQTHLALGSAVGATVLVAGGVRLPLAALLTPDTAPAVDGARLAMAGGLLLLCMVSTLFPDLDAPESELLHAPQKVTRGMHYTARAVLGVRGRSLSGRLLALGLGAAGLVAEAGVGALSLLVRSFTHHRGFTHELRGMFLFTGLVMGVTAALAWTLHTPVVGIVSTMLLVGAVWMLGYLTHLLADAATRAGIPLFGEDHKFHLLPPGRRVRTGTVLDTVLLRWAAWAAVLVMVLVAGRP
jgi:membrane-bound metal-dependent hydrolase YbcI (DUF457 family)